jgi:hypothetical protein
MVNVLQLVVLFLLTGGLTVAFVSLGQGLWALACLGLGVAWALVDWFGLKKSGAASKAARRRGGDPFMDGLGLALFTGLAAWGAWNGLSHWLALAAVLLALAAWDMGRFTLRMSRVPDPIAAARLERTHLGRLGLALFGGLLLGGLALLVRVQLDFGWALVIAAAAVIALSQAARRLKI